MPHGNAQGAGLCVLSHETCMPPLTSTHKHPTYWPERRHRTHPRPLTGSRSRAARPRARQPRTPRAACRTPCALPQRSRPGPPPGTTSHGAQRPRTDGHTRTTYRARRACPCDRARARRALRAMRRARRRLWPAHRAPTPPPLIAARSRSIRGGHPQHKDALHRRRPRVCGGGAARMATRARRSRSREPRLQRKRRTPASRPRDGEHAGWRQNELPVREADEVRDGARPSIERRADGCMSVPA